MKDIFGTPLTPSDNDVHAQLEELRQELSDAKKVLRRKRKKGKSGKKIKKMRRQIKVLEKKIEQLQILAMQCSTPKRLGGVWEACLPIIFTRVLDSLLPPSQQTSPSKKPMSYLPPSRSKRND